MAIVIRSEPNCLGELVRGFLRSQRGQRLKNTKVRRESGPPSFQGLNWHCIPGKLPLSMCLNVGMAKLTSRNFSKTRKGVAHFPDLPS